MVDTPDDGRRGSRNVPSTLVPSRYAMEDGDYPAHLGTGIDPRGDLLYR